MSEALIGVIIGALAAILGGILGESLKHNWQVKEQNRADRKRTYELAQKFLMQLALGTNVYKSEEISKSSAEVNMNMRLYASKVVYEKYIEHVDSMIDGPITPEKLLKLSPMSDEILKLMHEDLKIKRI